MTDHDPNPQPELREILEALHRRVGRLTVAVVLMALALFVLTATVLLQLVNYFAADPFLFAGASVGGVLVGFVGGWFARKRA